MPEGDTIHRAAATLHRALAGQLVTRFDSVYAHLVTVDAEQPLAGRRVESVSARGKHTLMTFDGNLTLRTHMRMHGAWHLYRHGERWQRPHSAMRILIHTEPWVAVAFDVPDAEFIRTDRLVRHPTLAALGPDIIDPAFDADEAVHRVEARPDQAIAAALLDQRLVAGIGNVYKSEVLFLAGVLPATPVCDVDSTTLTAIIGHARRLLTMNAGTGSGGRRTTGLANPAARLWVYERGGRPCRRCGSPIVRGDIEHRSTYWCPRCQTRPGCV